MCEMKIPACCDDDDNDDDVDCTIAITSVLSTEEPIDSLSMRDEHLDTIPATESDEVIKSSVEDLVPILSESEGIPDTMCDVHLVNNPTPIEAKDHFEIALNSNDDISSSDEDSLYKENIKYVKASPHDSELVSLEAAEIVILEEEEIEDDNFTGPDLVTGADLVTGTDLKAGADLDTKAGTDLVKEAGTDLVNLTGTDLVNTKFLNILPSEWSKFVTDVKLVRDLHTTNVDQLNAYLGQHEYHANEQMYQQSQFQPQEISYQSSPYGPTYHNSQFVSSGPSSLTHSISYPGTDTSSFVNHNAYLASSLAPQIAYAQMDQQSSEYS
nr:hypothetical protein [Tanacetum cinerariifolium]